VENAPNIPKWTIGIDEQDEVVDLEQLYKVEGSDIFTRRDIDTVIRKLRPQQFGPLPGIAPGENILTLRAGEGETETVTVTVPRQQAQHKLDVYFLADVTGSMGAVLAEINASSNAILNSVRASGVDAAFGVGSYRDFPGPADQAFLNQQPITTDDTAAIAAINAWSAGGGGDIPEAQLFALDRIAENSNGEIGWRNGSRKLVVWFGDAPGHEPICTELTGLPGIMTVSVANKLMNNGIGVIAISTTTGSGLNLDSDPTTGTSGYAVCGIAGGFVGQATTIANDTGGIHLLGIETDIVVDTIINSIGESEAMIGEVRLNPSGPSRQFIASISPPEYGPLRADADHTLEFTIEFSGNVQCTGEAQVFEGQIGVEVDGVFIAAKRLQVTVPACGDLPDPVDQPDPMPQPIDYVVDGSPSAVAIDARRNPGNIWQINVLAASDGGLVRAFNTADPELPSNWSIEQQPRPGGPGSTRIISEPFALRTTEEAVDPNFDFVHALVKGSDSDLHEITRSVSAWTTWTDRGNPRTAVADSPSAVGARRRFYYEEDAYLSDAVDRIFVFVWGADGCLWRYFQHWRAHGRPAPGVDVASPAGALPFISPGFGQVFAFIVGNDGRLYVNRSIDPEMEHWTWHDLAKPANVTQLYFLRRPAVVRFFEPNNNNVPQYAANVFVTADDRGLWDCRWAGIRYNGAIAPINWLNLGRPSNSVTIRGDASAVTFDDGASNRVYAFIRGSDGNLWANIRVSGAAVGNWLNLGKPAGFDLRGNPAAVTAPHPGSDPVYVFFRGSDRLLHYCHLNPNGSNFSWKTVS